MQPSDRAEASPADQTAAGTPPAEPAATLQPAQATAGAQLARLGPLFKRWLGLLALLLAEYLWVSLSFDSQPLRARGGMLGAFGYLGIAAPLLVVIAASIYMLAPERLRSEMLALLSEHEPRVRVLPCVIVNVIAYVGMYWLTAVIITHPVSEPLPSAWLFGWLALAVVTVLALLPAALPWQAVVPLLRRTFGLLIAGALAGALAWVAGIATGELFYTLRVATLESVYLLLYPFVGDGIIYHPEDSIIGASNFYVVVAPVCSGFEGIGLIFVFTIIYLASARAHLRFPQALLLVPLAIVLVWCCNAVRIALLIGVGCLISPAIALSGFHSKAGWLFFVAVALLVIVLAQRSRFFSHAVVVNDHGEPTWNPTATYLAPLLALIGTTLLTGLMSAGFDHFYVLRVLAVMLALYVNREHLPKPSWPPSWHAPVIGVVVFALWIVLIPRPVPDDIAAFRASLADLPEAERMFWVGARVFGASVTVPIAEELGFRAFLLRRLMAVDFLEVPKTKLTIVAVVASSLAFGAMHGGAWIGGAVAGLAYALAQYARGRTADAIIAHAVTNALIAVAVLGFGEDWLWV